MARKVRRYTPEFKQEAVHLALKSDSVVNTVKSLGLPPATLHTWIQSLKKKGKLSKVDADSGKDMSALVDENRRLHKALAIALEEKEILKKAAAYFAQHQLEQASSNVQRTMTSSQKIFQSLRPALSTKSAQKNQLTRLLEKYQAHQNSNVSELFVRCLCFELKNMNPDQVHQDLKPILSDLLWKHKYLSSDNFLLSLMENTLSFYLENPHCNWLSAFFTVKAETQMDKEAGMIAYVDQQDNATEKANLVTASRFSSLFTLKDEKRLAYGSLFRQVYHTDQSLSEREKKLILLSLSEMKKPVTETNFKAQFFQKSHSIINRNVTSRIYR